MLKFLMILNSTVAISAAHFLTGDPLIVAGSSVAAITGTGLAAWVYRRRAAMDVTSAPLPTFIPSSSPTFSPSDLPRNVAVAEKVVEHLGPIQDGDDVIPPFPNMGQHGKRYGGPDYFGFGVGKGEK